MRRLVPGSVIVAVLAITLVSTAAVAGAKSAPGWSLKFGGGITGSAKNIAVESCSQPDPAGGNQLAPTATFKVGKTGYQIQVVFAPPVQAGTRTFASTPSSDDVLVVVVKKGGSPSDGWKSGTGTATLKADLTSGTLKGQLIGLGANGIAATVKGKFSCPSFTP